MTESIEEDEKYFLVNLKGLFDSEQLKDLIKHGKSRIVNIDSEEPVIQIGRTLFVGRWEQVVGTDLILRDNQGKILTLAGTSDRRLSAFKATVMTPAATKEAETATGELTSVANVDNTADNAEDAAAN